MRFARGAGGMTPPPPQENFLKWCNLVRFDVYLDQILSLLNLKNCHFLYKNFKKYHFISKIDILDTCLLWCNSHKEIFGNILRLMRFSVYFERILNKK